MGEIGEIGGRNVIYIINRKVRDSRDERDIREI